jgi:hypothetical protein
VRQAPDGFQIELGDGKLICAARLAKVNDHHTLFVTAHSWLAECMVSALPRLPVASDPEDALGRYLLCPVPLRRVRDGKTEVLTAAVEALQT